MGGSGQQIKPKFLTPPDIGNIRSQFASSLAGLLSGGAFGNANPLANAAQQQGQGLLTGQGPDSASTSAYRTIMEASQTGLPANATPIAEQAYRNFDQYTAPSIRNALGAQYGIHFGTPVAESISRAGADVTSNLNAEFARLGENSQARRFAAASGTPGFLQGGYQLGTAPMQNFYDILTRGIGTLSSQGQFGTPSYAPGNQNLQAFTQLAAAIIPALLAA